MKIKRLYDKDHEEEIDVTNLDVIELWLHKGTNKVSMIAYGTKRNQTLIHDCELEFEQEGVKPIERNHLAGTKESMYICSKCDESLGFKRKNNNYCSACGTKILWGTEDE